MKFHIPQTAAVGANPRMTVLIVAGVDVVVW
jgi:hypothetical protein